MALLANCNHSIFDYGTYGMWGGLLSGGITLLAFNKAYLEKKTMHTHYIYKGRLNGWYLWSHEHGYLNYYHN